MGRRERLRWGDGEGGNGEGEGKVEKGQEWGGEGESGLGQWRGDWEGAMGRGRWIGSNLKEEMGRGATGRGRHEGGKGDGEKKGNRRKHYADGYDLMSGWT